MDVPRGHVRLLFEGLQACAAAVTFSPVWQSIKADLARCRNPEACALNKEREPGAQSQTGPNQHGLHRREHYALPAMSWIFATFLP